MRTNTFIKFIAGASLISIIACQKIKKEDQKSFADWQTTDVSELEKSAETKVSALLSCRMRPVENYHLYYSVYIPEKTSAKEEKVDKITVKFYDHAYLGNYIYSYNSLSEKASATSTNLSAKKVKVLIKNDELLNIIEVYEKDPTAVLTRAEEEDAAKAAAAEAAKKAEEEKLRKQADPENINSDEENESSEVEKAASESTEVTKDENLNAIDNFTKGYKLVLKLQKHSVTGESKNLSDRLPFNSILSDEDSLKAVTLECQ